MDSQTMDITHFADIFHYDVTMQALKRLRNAINCFKYLLDVRNLACEIKVLNGCKPGT